MSPNTSRHFYIGVAPPRGLDPFIQGFSVRGIYVIGGSVSEPHAPHGGGGGGGRLALFKLPKILSIDKGVHIMIRDFPDHATFREKGAKLACADKL